MHFKYALRFSRIFLIFRPQVQTFRRNISWKIMINGQFEFPDNILKLIYYLFNYRMARMPCSFFIHLDFRSRKNVFQLFRIYYFVLTSIFGINLNCAPELSINNEYWFFTFVSGEIHKHQTKNWNTNSRSKSKIHFVHDENVDYVRQSNGTWFKRMEFIS